MVWGTTVKNSLEIAIAKNDRQLLELTKRSVQQMLQVRQALCVVYVTELGWNSARTVTKGLGGSSVPRMHASRSSPVQVIVSHLSALQSLSHRFWLFCE